MWLLLVVFLSALMGCSRGDEPAHKGPIVVKAPHNPYEFKLKLQDWPKGLKLFTRTHEPKEAEYQDFLLPSLKVFAPHLPKGHLVIVLDDGEGAYGNRVEKDWPYSSIKYRKVEPNMSGHEMQQGAYFYADQYVGADCEYVGMVDTDSFIHSAMTKSSMFDPEGKPYVIVQIGRPQNSFWARPPIGSAFILQRKVWLRGMSSFPVVVKTAHLKLLREYVEKVHNLPGHNPNTPPSQRRRLKDNETLPLQPLEKEFKDIWWNPRGYGPSSYLAAFDVIVNYLWFFHREDYHFSLQRRAGPQDPASATSVPSLRPFVLPLEDAEDVLKRDPKLLVPVPRVATHGRHDHLMGKYHTIGTVEQLHKFNLGIRSNIQAVLERGFCLSGGHLEYPEFAAVCKERWSLSTGSRKGQFKGMEYIFEFSDWSWDPRADEIVMAHFVRKWKELRKSTTGENATVYGEALVENPEAKKALVEMGLVVP